MRIIDGNAIAAEVRTVVANDVARIKMAGVCPTLAVILVGSNEASKVYVTRKIAACNQVGIRSLEHRLGPEVGQPELLALIDVLNDDPNVHGILVQLPLPQHIDPNAVLDRIDPKKDVDGFHPVNIGRLTVGADSHVPCTPLGCITLLDTVIDDYRGLNAVVIGKSNIVGKPLALMLLERECTVSVAHIATRDLPDIVRRADLLVVATGAARLVRGDWVKPGAIVVDVGISREVNVDGSVKIVGDVCFDEMGHVGAITPVPGGVGPMTVASLLANTARAAAQQTRAV